MSEFIQGTLFGFAASLPVVGLCVGVVWWSLARCSRWEGEWVGLRAATMGVMSSQQLADEEVDPEDYAGE